MMTVSDCFCWLIREHRGRKHDFFMLDGSYEHFLYLTNDHQGEVILALLCDPVKTAELDRILYEHTR